MLTDSGVGNLGPTTWADLGCGDGTFTQALAQVLTPGSTIHAIDLDASALRAIPAESHGVRIVTHHADFTSPHRAMAALDGILMANSLHYVSDQLAFLLACAPRMTRPRRFLIVEYDTDRPNRWVPYPVSRTRLATLCASIGNVEIRHLATRPSIYQRAPIYAALVTWR